MPNFSLELQRQVPMIKSGWLQDERSCLGPWPKLQAFTSLLPILRYYIITFHVQVQSHIFVPNRIAKCKPNGTSIVDDSIKIQRDSLNSGIEDREYGRRDPLWWQSNNLHPQNVALTSPTSRGRWSIYFARGLRPRSFFSGSLNNGCYTVSAKAKNIHVFHLNAEQLVELWETILNSHSKQN
jgi:hypothetical protein